MLVDPRYAETTGKTGFKSIAGEMAEYRNLLHTSSDREVVLYFDFFGNSRGGIWIAEDEYTVFTATTSMTVDGNKLIISQDSEARSGNNAGFYNPYYFVCRPGKGGVADCAGVNKKRAANKVNFKLIKINE